MQVFKRFTRSESAATLLPIALSFMVIMGVVGVAVDIARQQAVKIHLQASLDEALLGAVATSGSIPVQQEAMDLFYANYPTNYLGSQIVDLKITAQVQYSPYFGQQALGGGAGGGFGGQGGANQGPQKGQFYTGQFYGTAKAQVPNMIMQLFGFDSNIVVAKAGVINNLKDQPIEAEVALVLDNTGSMTGKPIQDLIDASHLIVDLLFGGEDTLPNLHMSVVPYSASVLFDPAVYPHSRNWVQTAWQPRYDIQVAIHGMAFLSNRNLDNLNNGYADNTNVLPTTEATKFRTPTSYWHLSGAPVNTNNNGFSCPDIELHNQDIAAGGISNKTDFLFAENVRNTIHARLDEMGAGGCTRINVGALWGWLALSPTWQGTMLPSKPSHPLTQANNVQKYLIIMTDGRNTVYDGSKPNMNDDDKSLDNICTAAKGTGITVYTVTLGNNVNAGLMQRCATDPSHYFHAPSSNQLAAVFQAVADNIKQEWILLNK